FPEFRAAALPLDGTRPLSGLYGHGFYAGTTMILTPRRGVSPKRDAPGSRSLNPASSLQLPWTSARGGDHPRGNPIIRPELPAPEAAPRAGRRGAPARAGARP